MKSIYLSESMLVEKYRPRTVEDIILPLSELKKILYYRDNELPQNILMSSNTPGTGKTSIARSLITDLKADYLWINASKDNGIDMIRSSIYTFASSISFESKYKIVVLDECDNLSIEAQKSLRGVIEEFSKNCRFILTCNYIDKISTPILNRFAHIDLDLIFQNSDYKKELGKLVLERLEFILKNENIEYAREDLINVIRKMFPSIRAMIIFIQQNIIDNRLVVDFNTYFSNEQYEKILDAIKIKDFTLMRELVQNLSNTSGIYNFVWTNIEKYFQKKSLPKVIVMTHHYLDSDKRGIDKTITAAAFCASLLKDQEIEFN